MRTLTVDPQSPVLDFASWQPPEDPPSDSVTGHLPDDDGHGTGASSLRSIQLESIRDFMNLFPTEALMLERSRYDGWSLRDIADEYGGDAGHLCRKLPRIESDLRWHVLADVATWRLNRFSGFVLAPLTAEPLDDISRYAVSVGNDERLFSGRPHRDEIERYLKGVWTRLQEPFDLCDLPSRPCYFGGMYQASRNATSLAVVVLADHSTAMTIAQSEQVDHIYDVMLDLPISV